jgi:hypothetical protein
MPENVLYIPPFAYMNAHDTILQSFLHILQSFEPKSKKKKRKGDDTHKSFVVNVNDIQKELSILSPTNDDIYYPNGYIDQSTFRHYHANANTLQPNQKVIVPVNGVYVVASVVNVHTPKIISPEKPITVVVNVAKPQIKPVSLDGNPVTLPVSQQTSYRRVHVPLSEVVTDVDACKGLYVY